MLVSLEAVESASDSALEEAAGEAAEVADEGEVIEVTVVEVDNDVVTLVPLEVTVEAELEATGGFALDGTKGTEAGFKLDLMDMGPDEAAV